MHMCCQVRGHSKGLCRLACCYAHSAWLGLICTVLISAYPSNPCTICGWDGVYLLSATCGSIPGPNGWNQTAVRCSRIHVVSVMLPCSDSGSIRILTIPLWGKPGLSCQASTMPEVCLCRAVMRHRVAGSWLQLVRVNLPGIPELRDNSWICWSFDKEHSSTSFPIYMIRVANREQ